MSSVGFFGARRAVLFSMTAIACVPMYAFGQGVSTGGADTASVLEEIVVTAERRPSTEATTPISMVAISGTDLENRQLKTISDLQVAVPAVSVASAGVSNYVNIRGIGNTSSSAFITSGVAVFNDGVFEHGTTGLSTPFFDLASVEILRGPQGTFIGQSSTAGAILINSRDPSLDDVSGYVEGQVGTFTDKKIAMAVNLPLSETFAVRTAVHHESRNSFYNNIGSLVGATTKPFTDPGNLNTDDVRVGLLWQPSAKFRMLLKAQLDRSRNDDVPGSPNQNTYVDPVSGQEKHSTYYDYSTHDPFVLNYDYQNTFLNETYERYSLDTKYDFDSGYSLRSVTGLQRSSLFESGDGDASSANAVQSYNTISPRYHYSEDLTLLSPTDGRLSWIVGASIFYMDSTTTSTTRSYNSPYLPTSTLRSTTNTRTSATTNQRTIYGQLSYELLSSLQLQIGLRQNYDRNTGRNIQGATAEYTDSNPTGKIGLNWTPVSGQFFYVFASRGYKAGGVNIGQANFEPEHVDDYEIGWKGEMLDKRLRAELGAYYMKYQGMQIQQLNFSTGQANAVTNVQDSTIKGIEASLEGRFGGFGFDTNVAYTQSELGALSTVATYRLPDGGVGTLGPQCPVAGGGRCFDYTPYITNVAGGTNAYSPKITFNAGLDYGIPVGDKILRPRVTFTHTDKQYASIFQLDNYFLLGSRNLWNGYLSYEGKSWMAQIYGTNLTDQVYVAGTFTGAGRSNVYYGAPRQYGIRLSYSF